jgi:UDP-glucose 6-dehydrogenase
LEEKVMNIETIGIVGQGFVGGAIREGLKDYYNIATYDKFVREKSTCSTLSELTDKAIILFACLPTPMKKTGECDISIIDEVLGEINDCANGNLVVIKSTIPPGTSRMFTEKYKNISVVFNPEFLREKTANEDFINQNRIVLGGDRKDTMAVAMMYMKMFEPPAVKYLHTTYEVAEMTKYMTNTFLSTVISYANEIYDICEKLDINYDEVKQCAQYDERLKLAPLTVPGHDGDRFFGGHCFPKDLNCLMYVARELGVRHDILKSSWDECLATRGNKDWEQMVGRAVSEESETELEFKDQYFPPENKKDWYIYRLRSGDEIEFLDKFGYNQPPEKAIFSHFVNPEGEGVSLMCEFNGEMKKFQTGFYVFYNKERDVNGIRVAAEGK